MSDKREQGVQFFDQAFGEERGLSEHLASSEFGVEIGRWAAEFAFGTIWMREGLDRKLRSCVVLGMLMALRQPDEIKYHVRLALKNGLTVSEIEEILYTAVPYAGFPAAVTAKQAIVEALGEVADKS